MPSSSIVLLALTDVMVARIIALASFFSVRPLYKIYNQVVLGRRTKFNLETDGTVFIRLQNYLVLGTSLGLLLLFVCPFLIILSLAYGKNKDDEISYSLGRSMLICGAHCLPIICVTIYQLAG